MTDIEEELTFYSAKLTVRETIERTVYGVVKATSPQEAKLLFERGCFEKRGGMVGGALVGQEVTDISNFQTPEERRAEYEEDLKRAAIEEGWRAQVRNEVGNLCYSVGKPPDEIAFEGTAVVRHDWGWYDSDDSPRFQSEPLTNPTWLQIAKVASKAIEMSGDRHHSFLEGVSLDKKLSKKGKVVYQLSMGS